MNKHLLKLSGLASMVLLLHTSGMAQQHSDDDDTAPDRKGNEIIILRQETDKDMKVTIEVKDGQVTVNGKAVGSGYSDSLVTIRKERVRDAGRGSYSFNGD